MTVVFEGCGDITTVKIMTLEITTILARHVRITEACC